jgi:predicted dehydrogenase
MSKQKIRVGIVGTGKITQMMHLPFLHELPMFEVTALADISPGTLAAVADQYGVERRYEDHRQLIADDDVDAVLVCNFDHPEIAADALAVGKHVLVEKPLAFTISEADALVKQAERSGLVAIVGYMKLYDAGLDAGLERIKAIGRPRSITVHDFAGRFDNADGLYTERRANDADPKTLEAGRNAVRTKVADMLGPSHAGYADLLVRMLMIGSHDLAVLRHCFGAPQRVAYARPVSDSQILAVLDYPDNVPCVMEIGIGAKYNWWDESLTVYGERDEVRIEFAHPYLRYAPTVLKLKEAVGDSAGERTVPVSYDSPFRRELIEFAACIRGEQKVRSTFSGGLADVQLIADIVRAMPERQAGT